GSIAAEVAEQTGTRRDGECAYTHVFLQGGVGALAAGVASWLWEYHGERRPGFVLVEPEQADCLLQSAIQGHAAKATGSVDSVMAGLACGETSPLAWRFLDPIVDHCMTIADDDAIETMRLLARGNARDTPIVAGESGAAGLAALRVLRRQADLSAQAGLDAFPRARHQHRRRDRPADVRETGRRESGSDRRHGSRICRGYKPRHPPHLGRREDSMPVLRCLRPFGRKGDLQMMRLTAAALLLAMLSSAAYAQTNAGEQKSDPTLPFTMTEVASFDLPWRIAFLPDGRMLVTEKVGRVQLVTPQGAKTELKGVPPSYYKGQSGMLGVFLSPHYATDHNVYLTYSEPGSYGGGLALGRGRLVLDDGQPRLDGFNVLWRQMPKGKGGQEGAQIAFSPDGKYLFLTVGERQRM